MKDGRTDIVRLVSVDPTCFVNEAKRYYLRLRS